MDNQGAHGGKCSDRRTAWPEAGKFITQCGPEHLHQLTELITANTRHLNAQKIRRNSGLLQDVGSIKTKVLSPSQCSLDKVPGNGQIRHITRHFVKTKIA